MTAQTKKHPPFISSTVTILFSVVLHFLTVFVAFDEDMTVQVDFSVYVVLAGASHTGRKCRVQTLAQLLERLRKA